MRQIECVVGSWLEAVADKQGSKIYVPARASAGGHITRCCKLLDFARSWMDMISPAFASRCLGRCLLSVSLDERVLLCCTTCVRCILACALRPQHHLKEARVKDLVEWMNSHGGGREGR